SVRSSCPGFQLACNTHYFFETKHRRNRRGCPIESPVETAERNQRRAQSTLRKHDRLAEIDISVGSLVGKEPEHEYVRGGYKKSAPQKRLFAKWCRLVL